MKKLLEAMWEPFDSTDSIEWFLLIIGYAVLGLIVLGGVIEWI